jgi:ABC-type glycerol-3-phosphate transport system substrate-binding protein
MKTTMRKTYIGVMALMLVFSILLGACAPQAAPTEAPAPAEPTAAPAEPTAAPAEPTAAPAEPTAAPAEPTAVPETGDKPFAGTTINILLETVPDTNYVQELLPQFEEETGIKANVEVLTYVAMYEKLVPQLTVGEGNGAYDVIVVDKQWVGGFVGADWLTPLDDYIAQSGFDTSVYIPAMFEMLGEVNGTTYMLPFYNYSMGLYYRTDLFSDPAYQEEYKAKFGTDLKVPTTMDEFLQVAEFFKRDLDGDGNIDLYGITQQLARGVGIHAEWANIFFSLGGWYYDDQWNPTVNGPEGVQAVNYMIDLYEKAGVPGSTAYNFDEQVAVFNQGKAATMYSYSTMFAPLNNPENSKVAGNVGLAVAPGGSGVNGGWGWAIPRSAPNPDAAWAFMNWVESKEIAKERAKLGGSPMQSWLFEEPDLIELYPFYPIEQEILATGKPVPIIAGCAQMVDVLARELSLAVSEGKDPQQAMDDAAAEMVKLVENDPLVTK